MSDTPTAGELPPLGTSWVDLVQAYAPELLPRHNDDYPGGNAVVIASFSGWREHILPTRQRLQKAGFFVLAPHGSKIVDYAGVDGSFGVVDADIESITTIEERLNRGLTKAQVASFLEALFCAAIKKADFVYMAGLPRDGIDDGGYIGTTVAFELGSAMISGKVYGTEVSPSLDKRDEVDDRWTVQKFLRAYKVATPEELGRRYAAGEKL